MVLAIQFAVGICCFVIGLSMLFHRFDWLAWLDGLRHKGKPETLVIGMTGLFISSLILGFHQVWSGVPLIVTLIGLIGVIEGTVYLLCPSMFPKMLACLVPHSRFFVLWGILATVLGVIILCEWWGSYHLHSIQDVISATGA